MGNLFQELKRRNVYKTATLYVVACWVLLQVADTIFPAFGISESAFRVLTFTMIGGFPVAIALAWVFELSAEGLKRTQASDGSERAVPVSTDLVVILLLLVVVGFSVIDQFAPGSLEQANGTNVLGSNSANGDAAVKSRRFSIVLGNTSQMLNTSTNVKLALSRDGDALAYITTKPGLSTRQLYLLNLEELVPNLLADAFLVSEPFFSPDGNSIAYANETTLNVTSISGGIERSLSYNMYSGAGGFWSSDDDIYYPASIESPRIMKIPANGGQPQAVNTDRPDSDTLHTWPWLLPGNEQLLFTYVENPLVNVSDGNTGLLNLATGETEQLIPNAYNARYVPSGHLVFMRSASLWATPFDLQSLAITGPEVLILQGVQTNSGRGEAAYGFSDDGLLTYFPGDDRLNSTISKTLVWVDREGNEETLSYGRDIRIPTVSPDGRKLAMVLYEEPNNDIYVSDLTLNTLSRLTFDSEDANFPLWTPDGHNIVFKTVRDGGGIWQKAADGTGQATPLLQGVADAIPWTFTPDGQTLVFESGQDLYLLDLNGDGQPEPLLQAEYALSRAAISPDGNWIAYESNETGTLEIYVRPFPDVNDGKWQISNGGGQWARWSARGDEVFYRLQSNVVSVDITYSGNTIVAGLPQILFAGNYRGTGNAGAFDISNGGSRFLLIQSGTGRDSASSQTNLVVVENWFAELQRLAPSAVSD